jgi:hypothetical protein
MDDLAGSTLLDIKRVKFEDARACGVQNVKGVVSGVSEGGSKPDERRRIEDLDNRFLDEDTVRVKAGVTGTLSENG